MLEIRSAVFSEITGDQIWGRRWDSSSGLKEFGLAHGEDGAHRTIKIEEVFMFIKSTISYL